MELRDYQQKGMNLMRQAFADGNRKILFWLATGGGKSRIFIETIKNLMTNKKKVIFIVRRRQLVIQAYEHFKKNGIDASVIMGNDKRLDKDKRLQICSIDTVARRDISFMVDFDVVVADESHDCVSPTYQKFFEKLSTKIYIGLTATPFSVGNKVHDFWDCCVKPIEIEDLINRGYLVEPLIYTPEEAIDLSAIKKVAGDFKNDALAKKMSELEVIGNIVEDYKRFGEGKAAICFCVNKQHSITMAEAFKLAGIEAIHCDESTKQKDRDAAIERLRFCARNDKPFVLANVNIFSTGVDIPEANVGIMARPTASEVLYLQQIGRLLRPYRRCGKCKKAYDNSPACYHCGRDKPEFVKHNAIIIDSGNNVDRHGHPCRVRQAVMSKEDKKKKQKELDEMIAMKRCSKCFKNYEGNKKKCPFCESENEKVERVIKTRDGKLVPYSEFKHIQAKLFELEYIRDSRGFKQNFPYFKLYEQFGDAIYKYNELKVPKFIKKIVDNSKQETNTIYK